MIIRIAVVLYHLSTTVILFEIKIEKCVKMIAKN